MRKFSNLFILFGIIFLFLGCEQLGLLGMKPKKAVPKPPVGAIVVAMVGDLYITSDDLDKEIEAYNAEMTQKGTPKEKIDTRDKKIAYLRDQLVYRYMLYQDALDRNIDKNPDIERALEYAKMQLLVSKVLSDELQKIEVSDRDVEDFYNQNKEALKEPEQRRISEIAANTEDEARQANIELLRGTDFATVAKQYSKSDSANRGGDLGYLYIDPDPKKRIRFDNFYERAFSPSLGKGEISSIFKGPDGKYYIVKVEDIKKAQTKPLSELKDDIKNYLAREKTNNVMKELADRLKGQIKIEVYEGKVD